MASLDNESLFTNIPLNETIERDLFKLLETATSETSFIFDYLLYKKVCGMTMGWVPPLQMHFYAIMKKNGWIIVQPTLNL